MPILQLFYLINDAKRNIVCVRIKKVNIKTKTNAVTWLVERLQADVENLKKKKITEKWKHYNLDPVILFLETQQYSNEYDYQ